MLHPVTEILNRLSPLSEATQQSLQSIIEFKHLPKTTQLLQIGSVSRHMYFISKGLARVFYLKDGLDVTDYFAIDNQFIGGMASLFLSKPTHKAIELLEDSDVYIINYTEYNRLCSVYHDLERVTRLMAQFGMLEEQHRIESIRFYSVKERYQELELKYPGITNRTPLKHIASYLNTSNVSISRIRAGKQ